jgi:hypothetical protein
MKKKKKFAFLTVRSCSRLLGEHVQKVLQKLTTRIGKEIFFPCARQRKKLPILCKKTSFLSSLLNGKSVLGIKKFPYTLFISPPPLKFSKNHDQKQSHNCMTESGKMTHLSLWAFRG